jgi:hypothetical protein
MADGNAPLWMGSTLMAEEDTKYSMEIARKK